MIKIMVNNWWLYFCGKIKRLPQKFAPLKKTTDGPSLWALPLRKINPLLGKTARPAIPHLKPTKAMIDIHGAGYAKAGCILDDLATLAQKIDFKLDIGYFYRINTYPTKKELGDVYPQFSLAMERARVLGGGA